VAVTAVATAIPTLASAQDYSSSGSLIGTVKDSAASPFRRDRHREVAGPRLHRNLTTDGSGQFRAPDPDRRLLGRHQQGRLPADQRRQRPRRLGGTSTAYGFTLLAVGDSVSEVVVTGTANPQLDFAATTKGLVVDIETLTKQAPIARNADRAEPTGSVGVVAGDSARVSAPAVFAQPRSAAPRSLRTPSTSTA
jgi:hypothetical protein